MKLKELLQGVEVKKIIGDIDAEVSGISCDSKLAKKGFCFVAIRGANVDGHKFILDAIKNGASVIVSEKEFTVSNDVSNVIVSDTRLALAGISSQFFGNPSRSMRVTGITGTNGKTTTTYLIESILNHAGGKTGVIGTVNWRYAGHEMPAPNTTPISFDLQSLLHEMKKKNISDVVMEVSSHALDQGRVEGVHFDTAIFTNLTQDHLDYNKNLESYYTAKKLFFDKFLVQSLKKEKTAIINKDDEFGMRLISECKQLKKITYGFGKKADVKIEAIESTIDGNKMKVATPWGHLDLFSRLKGRFNALNVLAAIAVCGTYKIRPDIIKEGIETVVKIPGRLEDVQLDRDFSVFVDYAHTPDALKNVLSTLKPLTSKRIITVFGCGGDRDKGKRQLMGEIAADLSNVVIVTSDNPRSEDPAKIIEDILPGITGSKLRAYSGNGTGYMIEKDRAKAIAMAVKMAAKGDIILIAGKGHEDYQIIGNKKTHFDDKEEVRRACQQAGKCVSV